MIETIQSYRMQDIFVCEVAGVSGDGQVTSLDALMIL